MDIVYLLKVLWRKKWILISVPIITLVVSFLLTSNLPKEYISRSQLSTGFTSGESIYYEENFSLKDANVKFANVIQTIRSPLVINLLSYRLLIHELNSESFRKLELEQYAELKTIGFKNSAKEVDELNKLLELKLSNHELLNRYKKDERIIQELLKAYRYDYNSISKSLEVYRIGSSDYLEIKYSSENPFLSSFVVNTLSEEFISYYNHLKSFKNNTTLTYYTKLLEEKKKYLDNKNNELNNLKSRTNIFNSGVSETKLEQIKEYEIKRENYKEEINSYQIQIESLNTKINSSSTNDESTSNERIIELRNKINELSKLKLNQNEENKSLDKTLSDLRKELTYEMSKLSVGESENSLNNLLSQKEDLELKLKISTNNLKTVEASLASLNANVSGLASKESSIIAAEKEADKAMEEYLQVLNQYNEEKNKSLITNSSINLIIPGQPSDSPESSKRILIILFSAISSFSLSLFFIIFLEYIDFRLKTPASFNRTVKLKLIGSINKINVKKIDLIELFKQPKRNNDLETFKQLLRKVRYEVETNSSESNVILVTSNKKGEGKTFLVLSLAYSLNLLKKKILIIDTNFKNNDLTKLLLPNGQSNNNLLDFGFKLLTDPSRETDEEFNNKSIISGTSHQNIDLIGSIELPESPSEIFSGKDFNEMISSLSRQYDYVFLEGASLNEYSDTKELVNFAGKVIAVFSAETVISQKDRESISYLKSLNGKFMGSVLNKVELKDLEF